MLRKKDDLIYNEGQIRALYPRISFAPSTYGELGWEPYFSPPVIQGVVIPQVISPFQAKAVLAEDNLLETVEGIVAMADIKTQLAWKEVTEFRRDSPTIAAVAAILEWTEEYLDELFTRASTIRA